MSELPKEWLPCKISNFSHIIMGQSPASSTYNSDGIGLPFYQGKAEFGAIYPDPVKYCKSPKKIAEKGATLLSVRAPVGPTNIAPHRSCIGRGLAGIHPLGGMQDRFIFYLFRSYEPVLSGQGTGTTFRAITKDFLFDLNFGLPSLPEQIRILEVIEELFSDLDNAIENLRKAQEQLDVYRQAVLKYAFDGKLLPRANEWKYLSLSEVCQFNPSKNEIEGLDDNSEVSFLPMAYISETGKIMKHGIKGFKDVKNGYTYFRNNDVLLAKITPCFENGKKAIAENLINAVGFGSTEFHVLRPKDEVMSKWILLAVSQEDFRNSAIIQMTGAVGQKRVPQRVVEGYKIPVPPKVDQNKVIQEIEARFSVCDKLEDSINESTQKAVSLRQSILKQAFDGKLTERWRRDHQELISGENSAEALLKKIKAEKEVLKNKSKGKKHD